AVTDVPPVPARGASVLTPEPQARIIAARKGVLYAAGEHVWRSEDAGAHWKNLTAFEGRSILGSRISDLAVSPTRLEELTVANRDGVWRSADGGASWSGLNDGLPNLPAVRLLAAADAESAVRIVTASGMEAAWRHGEQQAWRPTSGAASEEAGLLSQLATTPSISAAARSGDTLYAGSGDGRLSVSLDRGRTWTNAPAVAGAGRIVRIVSDPRDPAFALAITDTASGAGRVLRTVNRGAFWDDITGGLPAGAARGIALDRLTGAVYVAAASGLYMTWTDTRAAAPPGAWLQLRSEPAHDVMLDAAGHQIFTILDGAGVYAAMAPHRVRDPRVVTAADRVARAAAPGALLSVLGARVRSAVAGDRPASVLAATAEESQIQLPWDLPSSAVLISMTTDGGNRIQLGVPVQGAAPAIFVDKDGSALLLDGDSGLMLDAGTPAHARSRLQILASGLGSVSPAWPAGLAAPLQDPPQVEAPVRVYLDGQSVEVLRATLAPGYVGLYIVEVRVPTIVNRGTAELYLEAAGIASNRVRLWLEP
ncbi:MAG TPA: hypothetical protein VES20_09260, partial [Bryobacteraceae bacterium]|nr:hypothetical protein [Bryobacteraceae bacterium]